MIVCKVLGDSTPALGMPPKNRYDKTENTHLRRKYHWIAYVLFDCCGFSCFRRYIKITTHFRVWSNQFRLIWRPAIQWYFHEQWVFSWKTVGRHNKLQSQSRYDITSKEKKYGVSKNRFSCKFEVGQEMPFKWVLPPPVFHYLPPVTLPHQCDQ